MDFTKGTYHPLSTSSKLKQRAFGSLPESFLFSLLGGTGVVAKIQVKSQGLFTFLRGEENL